jgi:hypothetical protein
MEKKDKDGKQKKEEVMNTIKCLIGEEEFNKTEDILNYILETIIITIKLWKILNREKYNKAQLQLMNKKNAFLKEQKRLMNILL